MKNKRAFHKFTYKDSNFRLCCRDVLRVTDEIIRQRTILEDYIVRQPEFRTSLVPLRPLEDAPEIAMRMCRAGMDVGVGPMAAVAGAIAQFAAEAAVAAGEDDVIVENGGDIFTVVSNPLTIGVHAGPGSPFNGLAFRVEPEDTPLAICSSSGTMGHSMSMGACDLATVGRQRIWNRLRRGSLRYRACSACCWSSQTAWPFRGCCRNWCGTRIRIHY